MKRTVLMAAALVLSMSGLLQLRAADAPAVPGTPATIDEATQKRIDAKAKRFIDAARIDDPAKAERVKAILGTWFVAMWDWHKQHDAELATLWSEWNKARAVVPKDEFPGEIIAHKIDDAYGSLKPAYQSFLKQLATELSQEQIDAIKEAWSRSPGMKRTYDAYLEIVPDLTEDQKKVIYDRMLLAREAAMLTDADREIVNIYKIHKVKVEAYVGTLEWAKLHRAFANRGKAPTPAQGASGSAPSGAPR
jgi:hypothetical protein